MERKNAGNNKSVPFDFCKMSIAEPMMLRLDISTGSIINSDCATAFHAKLKQECNIEAVGSFIKGSSEHLYTTINIWVNDNEVTCKLFEDRTFCSIDVNDRLYNSILMCLQSVFNAYGQSESSTIISRLIEIQRKSQKKLLTIQLIDFNRQYIDDLYGITAESVEQTLRTEFPQYANFNYANGVITKDALGNFAPIFLFYTPADLNHATENRHLERMIDVAYNTIAPKDTLMLLKKEHFQPQIISRRDLSKQQLYDIDMNIFFRKRAE